MKDNWFDENNEKKAQDMSDDSNFSNEPDLSDESEVDLDKFFESFNLSHNDNSSNTNASSPMNYKRQGGTKVGLIVFCSLLVVAGALIFGFFKLKEQGNIGNTSPDNDNAPSEESTHTHTSGNWICDEVASCTKNGLEHRECSECGEIMDSRSIPAIGHDEIHHSGRAPTCNTKGWTNYITCSRCNYTGYSEIEATGHSTNDGTCTYCNALIIGSVETLYSIRLDSRCYLMCDLDLQGKAWYTIGDYNSAFTGSFEGNGHTISNFEIVKGTHYTGFFGYNLGGISNLGLVDFTVNSDVSCTGGLVGYNKDANITNCYVKGDLYTSNISGGLVGENRGGTISFCYSECNIDANPSDCAAGHCGVLVGFNRGEGIITNCYATGSIIEAGLSGGLVGRNIGTIKDCYATGDVAASAAGGFVSTNLGTIINCYYTGNVSYVNGYTWDEVYSGGLVGMNGQFRGDYYGVVENCYATGNVSVKSENNFCYLGGLIGYEDGQLAISNSVVRNSYYYSGQKFSMYKNGVFSNKATTFAGTAAEISQLKSIVFQKETLGWSEDSWIFSDGMYPTLKTFDQYNDGNASEDSGHVHILGAWIILREPTCDNSGLKSQTCQECNLVITTESISSLGHTYGQWYAIPSGGCSTESYSMRVCLKCKTVDYNKNVAGISHPHNMKLEVSEPECTNSGKIIIRCTNCNIVGYEEILEKLGHDLHYIASSTMHTQICQRVECNYRGESQMHISSVTSGCVDNACAVCGYLIWDGVGHSFSNSYNSDSEYHWPICERADCNISQEKEPHTSINAKCTDASAICDVCKTTYKPINAHIMGEWYIYSEATCETGEIKRRNCTLCMATEEERSSPLGHLYGDWTITISPTETTQGEKQRECVRCDHVQSTTISPTGHNYGAWYITTQPTCLIEGEKRRDCLDCNYFETELISAHGHYTSNWIVTQLPSCILSGTRSGKCDRCGSAIEETLPALGHSWNSYANDTTHHWKICSECNTKGYYGSHIGGENRCEHGAICSLCNYEYGTITGHRYESSYSYDESSHYYSCVNGCGNKTQSSPHTLSVYNETLTTTDDGQEVKYTHNFYKKCNICGYQEIEKTIVGSEHYGCTIMDYVAPTCTSTGLTWGWKCAVKGCRDVYVAQEVIPALGHNYINNLCTRCGHQESGSTSGGNQSGHICSGTVIKITQKATCQSTGIQEVYCSCGKYIRKETTPLGNHICIIEPGKEATCTSTGISDFIQCTVCEKVIQSRYTIPAQGHSSSRWIVDTRQTFLNDGIKHKECLVCGYVTETETIESEWTVIKRELSDSWIVEYWHVILYLSFSIALLIFLSRISSTKSKANKSNKKSGDDTDFDDKEFND